MKTAIIGSGVICDYNLIAEEIKTCDFIICADGGIRHLDEMNIAPDVVIGDFDSCKFDYIKNLPIIKDSKIIKHNPVKDDTDMQLCIDYALENGADYIVMFASLGGRIDHELSNIFHLEYINNKGVAGMVFSEKNRIYLTTSSMTLKKIPDFKMSVISLAEKSEGVSLLGVYYPLDNATLVRGSSLGISNEIVDPQAEITVKKGALLVFHSKD